MDRVLEPEYMDTAEEALSYAGMDHASANESVVAAFVEAGGRPGAVLDIGTGPGDIPLLLAAALPGVRVVAIDAAGSMLALAREKVDQAGLTARISLLRGDAKALPFADTCFDGVISNTILHHIPEPVHYLREAS